MGNPGWCNDGMGVPSVIWWLQGAIATDGIRDLRHFPSGRSPVTDFGENLDIETSSRLRGSVAGLSPIKMHELLYRLTSVSPNFTYCAQLKLFYTPEDDERR
jgi:hypothetical protein